VTQGLEIPCSIQLSYERKQSNFLAGSTVTKERFSFVMSRVKWKTIANVPGLLKDEVSGRYYARFWRDSKPVWISLKTDVPTVAKARIAKERKAFESSKKTEAL
jgi:hypothetical protein